jgi:hypothetical protein
LLFAQAVDQLAASTAGHATFRLTVTLAAGSQNMYALFGRAGSLMAFPAAFQVAAPFGSNTAGVNPAFYAVSPDAEFDSWLTIGITDSEPAGAISSIGIDWSGWSEAAGLGTADGAVFYMDPDTGATMLGGAVHDGVQSPPPGPIVVAQLTVPVAGSSFTATAGAQGRSANGAPDWEELNLSWSTAAGGGSPPPPPALPSGGGEHCDDLLQGVVNSCVGSDGEGNPIARSHGCAGCINPATGAPLAVFIGMVRPAGQPSCVMPNEMDADVMMACLCADPPTCTRGAASHNTALIPPPPPAAASQDCHAGQQPSAGGSCQPCMQNHFSEDGTACLICNAGSGVNDARTNCWPCAGNNYSPDGTACTACPVNKQPNAGHTECETVAAPPPPPGTTNAGQMAGGRPPRAVVAQLCTIGDVFAKITTVKGDANCQAGCAQGTGVCPQNWYPGANDICNAECGRVFEPFCAPLTSTALLLRPLTSSWLHTYVNGVSGAVRLALVPADERPRLPHGVFAGDQCGEMLTTAGMGGMEEMSNFYDSCLSALYPPGTAVPDLLLSRPVRIESSALRILTYIVWEQVPAASFVISTPSTASSTRSSSPAVTREV